MITIIATISPIMYVGVSSYFSQAYDYHRKKDLKDIEVVMEYYYDAASAYPSTIPACGEPLMYHNRVIFDSFPCDPKTKLPYVYLTDELTEYQWYKIYTKLDRASDPSISITGCSDGCGPNCAYNFGVASSNISITACIWSVPHVTPEPTTIPTVTIHPSPTPTGILLPSQTPTEQVTPPVPTPVWANYVCAPGGGQVGSCEVFDDPDRSLCPFVYPNDPTCKYQCGIKNNECKNSSGKHKPE